MTIKSCFPDGVMSQRALDDRQRSLAEVGMLESAVAHFVHGSSGHGHAYGSEFGDRR
jgi:hypothetical protein